MEGVLSSRLSLRLGVHDGWSTGEGALGRCIVPGLEVECSTVEVEGFGARGRNILPLTIRRGFVLKPSVSSSEEVSGERSDSSAL